MAKTLKEQAVKGVFWSTIEKLGMHALQFVSGIIMARILGPDAYGLLGMVLIFYALGEILLDSGFANAYIQKQDATETDANTVFYFNLLVSSTLYLLLWLGAPYIAKFFNEPELVKIVRIYNICLIIKALSIIQITKLRKSLNFKIKAKISFISTAIGTVIGIYFAIAGHGVWSLVYMRIIQASIDATLLWLIVKWHPKFVFSYTSLKSLFGFGGWMLLSSIVYVFFERLYDAVIGKYYSKTDLGYFTNARKYKNLALQQISGPIVGVSFPVFSKMSGDKERLKNAMTQFLNNSMFFSTPFFLLIIINSEPFVKLLLGEQWSPMIPFLQLFCLSAIVAPIQQINVQALLAFGYSKLSFFIVLISCGIKLLNIIITYKLGIVYMISGEVIVSVIFVLLRTYYTKRFFNYGIFEQVKNLKKTLYSGLMMISSGILIILWVENLYLQFISGIIIPTTVYLLIQYFINKSQFLMFYSYIKTAIPLNNKKNKHS